jgi:tetratricopeptide (TPR) repeat protein
MAEARAHVVAGRMDGALADYKAALVRAPRDWRIVGEVAEFVGLQLNQYASGLELARAAVALNPWYSAWLWNVLGDCCFCLGRIDDAHEAYLQAERISPIDPRTNLNLAYTYLQFGDCDFALAAIAVGLANDARGQFRDRLLAKQQQILAALSVRWLSDEEHLRKRAERLKQMAQGGHS